MFCSLLFDCPLHYSRGQNCLLPLSSSKSPLCSRQTFHVLVFVIVSNMYLIVYDDGHVIYVVKVLRLKLQIRH